MLKYNSHSVAGKSQIRVVHRPRVETLVPSAANIPHVGNAARTVQNGQKSMPFHLFIYSRV
jgi:hypothetical protein